VISFVPFTTRLQRRAAMKKPIALRTMALALRARLRSRAQTRGDTAPAQLQPPTRNEPKDLLQRLREAGL
jgi:hypothetical protein